MKTEKQGRKRSVVIDEQMWRDIGHLSIDMDMPMKEVVRAGIALLLKSRPSVETPESDA